MAVHLAELRDLSKRSRRAQRWGFLALIVAFLLFPAQLLLARWVSSSWLAFAGFAIAALPALRYAYLAGEERGAFRRVFRRLADERRARTIVPSEPARGLVVEKP